MVNTNELKAVIVRHGKTQSEVAKAIGISTRSFNSKLNSHSEFKTTEIECIVEFLKIENPLPIFFAR